MFSLAPFLASADETATGSPSVAELSIEELMKVKVTSIGSGTAKPETESPAVATVLTASDLELMGATTMSEALNAVPGLHVSRTGHRLRPRYLIRGITTAFNPQVLVLLNGMPLTSLLRGDRGTTVEDIPIAAIARIEVIRGPGSALYGADAYAGVINVVTKTAPDFRGSLAGLGVGGFDTQQAWLGHGATYGDLDLSFLMTYDTTGGHRRVIETDAQSALDLASGTDASRAPGPMQTSIKAWNLFVDAKRGGWGFDGYLHSAWNLGAGAGIAQALDTYTRARGSRAAANLSYVDENLLAALSSRSEVGFFHSSQEFDRGIQLFPPGTNLGGGEFIEGVLGSPEFWERQLRLRQTFEFSGWERHRLRFGLGYHFGHLYRVKESKNFDISFAPLPGLTDVTDTPAVFIPEHSRHSYDLFVQDEWKLHDSWELTAGARYDHYSDFGGTLNPRLALVWAASPRFTGKLLYGRAFRAPSMAELYTINNPVSLGNPDLEPELLDSIELAWSYEVPGRWFAGINFFRYEAKDLISFVQDPAGPTATARNFADQVGSGVELEARFRPLPRLALVSHHAIQDSTNENSGRAPGLSPNHKGYARVDWSLAPAWSLSGQFSWVGERKREPLDPRAPLNGFTTADLIVRHQLLGDRLRAMVTVQNVFDEDVREPSGGPGAAGGAVAIPGDIPQAGRRIYAELVYRL
ncbi:MAG: TonB-dependent receptor [Oligoflexia bacterium]|nr:TonB-dependent receptor [Oligoflexia bacterium]